MVHSEVEKNLSKVRGKTGVGYKHEEGYKGPDYFRCSVYFHKNNQIILRNYKQGS